MDTHLIAITQINCTIHRGKLVNLGKQHSYEHQTKSVETSHDSNVAILWKQQLKTDKNHAFNERTT
jgi:hypothetical protein